jgi:hypothetical protein
MLSLPNDGRYPALDLPPEQRRQRTLEALTARHAGLASDVALNQPGSRLIVAASLAPEILEPTGRQFSIPHRVLNICDRGTPAGSGVMSLVRQRKSTSMAQHMRMGFESSLRLNPSPLNHPGKSRYGEWRTTFAGENALSECCGEQKWRKRVCGSAARCSRSAAVSRLPHRSHTRPCRHRAPANRRARLCSPRTAELMAGIW